MKHLSTLVIVLCVACGPQSPDVTPEMKLLINADAVVVSLHTLEHAAIELNKKEVCDKATPVVCKPLLSLDNTRVVVDTVVDTLMVMGPAPLAVQPSVKAALDVIERRLDEAGRASLLPYIQAVKAVVGLIPLFQ